MPAVLIGIALEAGCKAGPILTAATLVDIGVSLRATRLIFIEELLPKMLNDLCDIVLGPYIKPANTLPKKGRQRGGMG